MNPPTKKRWLSFSLRTMLVLLTIVCVWLGFKVHRVERQKAAITWVESVGGTVSYDYELDEAGVLFGHYDQSGDWICDATLPRPRWLRELIGVDYLDTVISVTISDSGLVDLSPLTNFTELKWLHLVDNADFDAEILKLKEAMPNCEIEQWVTSDYRHRM